MQSVLADIANWVKELSPAEFWIGIAVLSGIAIYAFSRMYRGLHHARLIQNIPTARIRSAPQGYVELIGTAKTMEGPITVSPLSQTVCLWYRFKIEEKYRDSKGRSHWRVVESGVSDEIFLIEDETDQCAIDPDDAQVITEYKKVWYKHNVIPPRRYTEELIREGEPFYAMGLFKSVAQIEDKTIREQVSLTLRQWKNDPNQLLHKYDENRDGQISPQEWEQAQRDAHAQVKRNIGNKTKLKQLSMLQASYQPNQPYILSTVPEHKLISHYRNTGLLAMLIFLLAGIAVVWAMNVRVAW